MPFQPAPWLRNAHLQTLWAPLFRKAPALYRQRERLILPDNDFLDLDWCHESFDKGSESPDQRPLVALFHGLTGSSSSTYILGMQHALERQDWPSVAINFRGCSGRPNRLPRAYHSGETGDIHFVLHTLRQRFPDRPIIAMGYSLGGNALCKWLGEQGDQSLVNAAVVVSAPYQLARCSTRLDQGFSKVYRKRLIGELTEGIEQKKSMFIHTGQHQHWQTLENLGRLSDLKSFWEFDEKVVAPLHGFASAADYYERSSARQFVPNIKTRTLLVHACDDPFMPEDVAPTPDECPEKVTLVLTPSGGHVGFVTGSWIPWKIEFWLEQYIPGWLTKVISQ